MQVFVRVKSIGKRKPALTEVPYALPDNISTLRELLTAVVEREVARYNGKEAETAELTEAAGMAETLLLPFLTEAQIEDQSATGKVGFGRIYSNKKADVGKAVFAAVQGFEDGLFRVMVNDTEASELDVPLDVKAGDVLTFIRLTFLAGRLW
jgi:hypothetical protein